MIMPLPSQQLDKRKAESIEKTGAVQGRVTDGNETKYARAGNRNRLIIGVNASVKSKIMPMS